MYSYLRTGTLRRVLLFSTALCALGSAALAQHLPQAYPARPIRLIVPLATGGGTDIAARLFAQKLSERFGQQVVVDNRPGAGGVIGAELAAKATPDGYTFAVVSSSHTVHPAMHRKLPYDTVRDFAPVSLLVSYPFLLVARPSLPARSVGELIAAAKAAPQSISYASSGNGSAAHLAAELFKSLARIDILHVPYKGSGPAVSALLAGEVAIGFYSASATAQHVRNGRLKALATTGEKRFPTFPELPTMTEAGISGYEATTWAGMLAPAATARQIITRMHRELITILAQADVGQRLAGLEFEPVGSSPEEFGRVIRREMDKWAKVVKESGAKID